MVEKITTPVTQLDLIKKVNEIIEDTITVDTTLSSTSINPVQNKVIYQALTAKADTTSVPTKTSDLSNDSGFIQTIKVNGTVQPVTTSTVSLTIPDAAIVNDSNMVIQKNGTAVGTFTANQSSASTINISVPTTASDVNALPDSTVIGSAFLTIKRNGTAIGSFGANSTIPVNIDITVPDSVTVDTVMSTTSTNPVQNKVITSAIANKTVATFTNVSAGTSATVSNLIINKVTSAEYATITPSDTELYFITDDSGITSADIIDALGYTPYNSTNPNGYQANTLETVKVNGTALTPSSKTVDITIPVVPTVGNANLTIQKNGSGVATFSANSTVAVTANISVPTTITELASTTQMAAINSGVNTTVVAQVTTNKNNIANIQTLIPSAATASNQLADKSFVNSSISTNTANFIGTFNSVTELEAYSGTLTNNDYAFVTSTDTAGNTVYNRYKYNSTSQDWVFEYALNNSSFTADQWAAINSSITSTLTAQITTNKNEISTIKSTMSGYGNIVTHNVGEFATAAQGSLADSALQSGDSNTLLTNDAGYITGITSGDVTTALGYTPYNSTNPNGYQANTIETIKVNGTVQTITTKTVSLTIPAAPTVNDSNMVIQRNSTAVGTFTANQSSASTINISVPTTAADVSAVPTSRKINGKTLTADITLSASDVGALPDSTVIPTVNDSNMVIQRNSTAVGTFTANQSAASTINISVPTTAADVSAVPTSRKINGKTLNADVTLSASDVGALPDSTVIPTVNNANMVIQRNSTAVGTFTANQSSASTINISVPTTAADVSAVPTSRTINGKTLNADVTLTASDVGALPDSTTIPTVYNANMVIKRNNTAIGTFTANQSSASTINITVPTTAADVGALPSSTTIGNGSTVFKKNGTAFATATANQTSTVNVDYTIPSEVTETTVSGWGFTKNVGTVTSVNNVSPDANGNVTIATGGTVDQTYNASSANAQSGVAIAGAGFLQVKGAITNSTNLTALEEGIYTIDGITNSGFPDASQAFYGVLVQYGGTYKPQLLVAGLPSVGGLYHRRYLTGSSAFTGWVRCGNSATGSNSFSMGGTPAAVSGGTVVGIEAITSANYGTSFGYKAKCTASSSVAIGRVSTASGSFAIAIGYGATVSSAGGKSIQLGYGTNSTPTSLSVGFQDGGNYQLLDGTTGKIPTDRINVATSVTSSSTNAEVVGAKLFYDTVGDIETLLSQI